MKVLAIIVEEITRVNEIVDGRMKQGRMENLTPMSHYARLHVYMLQRSCSICVAQINLDIFSTEMLRQAQLTIAKVHDPHCFCMYICSVLGNAK